MEEIQYNVLILDEHRKFREPLKLEEVHPVLNVCRHKKVLVDEQLAFVKCGDCGELLNPVAVLLRFAREETRWQCERLEIAKSRKNLNERKRVKCSHCGKFTNIKA